MNKALELLRKYDHVWGLPLSVLILIGGNVIANHFFNDPLISTEYLAPLFYTACVMTFVHAVSFFGMWLNHKDIFKAYTSEFSFAHFNGREKIIVYLIMYSFYVLLTIFVFIYANNLMFQ